MLLLNPPMLAGRTLAECWAEARRLGDLADAAEKSATERRRDVGLAILWCEVKYQEERGVAERTGFSAVAATELKVDERTIYRRKEAARRYLVQKAKTGELTADEQVLHARAIEGRKRHRPKEEEVIGNQSDEEGQENDQHQDTPDLAKAEAQPVAGEFEENAADQTPKVETNADARPNAAGQARTDAAPVTGLTLVPAGATQPPTSKKRPQTNGSRTNPPASEFPVKGEAVYYLYGTVMNPKNYELFHLKITSRKKDGTIKAGDFDGLAKRCFTTEAKMRLARVKELADRKKQLESEKVMIEKQIEAIDFAENQELPVIQK